MNISLEISLALVMHDCSVLRSVCKIFHIPTYNLSFCSRCGQLDRLRESHFRNQQSARAMSYFIFLQMSFECRHAIEDRKYEDETENLRQSGKNCLCLRREI
jgi:hypothetical protein